MGGVVIAGAGAAGLFAAGQLLRAGCAVTLVEHMDGPGKKLAITGKGRCNLTSNCEVEDFLAGIRHNPRFLYSAAHALSPAAAMRFFEEALAIPLKTERGRRVFPQSDDARDVVDALVRAAKGATWIKGRAKRLLAEDGRATGLVLAGGKRLPADAVLVATGGLSYPVTGATGDGYALAQQAGHTIVQPRPSLVALLLQGGEPRALAGLSLRNVRLALQEDGKAIFSEQGELLFTHFGISGPLTLSASAFVGDIQTHRYAVSIDLKPALTPEQLDARIQRDFTEAANRDAANALDKLLPHSLRAVALARWGVEPRLKVNQITRAQRRQLCELLKDFRFEVTGLGDLDHAVITAGGVSTKEVEPKTMQSKKLPGLYFAGEVLDVDGYTGGYNLQIAWCTAFAAAEGIAAADC